MWSGIDRVKKYYYLPRYSLQTRNSRGTQIALREIEENRMETFAILAALFGSFAGAFWLQKVALEGLFRAMGSSRRADAVDSRR